MDDSFFTEKEKKKVNRGNVAPVVVVVLVIIALGALLFFGGRYYLSSRNNIKILVDNYFNYLEENIVNTNSKSGSLKFNVKGDTNGDNGKVFKILNNLDFTINYDIDYKNDIVNLDLNTNYYGDKLIDINTYIENNTLYFYSGDLYNKYIEYKIDKDGNGEKVTKEDIKTLVNGIKNAISESLKDEYFTKSNEKVDGKMLNKVELNLNNSNTKSIYEDIINCLLRNDSFIDSAARLMGKNIDEVKELFNDELNNIEDDEYIDTTISLYTKFTKFAMLEIKDDNNKLTIKKEDNIYSYKLDGSESYNGTIEVNSSDENYNVIIKCNDDLEIKINGSFNKNTEVDKKDVSNSVMVDEITENEMEEIFDKVSKNKAFKRIYEDITNNNNLLMKDGV
ncbi:MAG: hypothetical protein ACI310_01335 [Bacilli bacterium]